MTLWQIFKSGGITMYVLFLCSILSVAVIIERFIYYKRRAWIRRSEFMDQVKLLVQKGHYAKAVELCEIANTAVAEVAHAGLKLHGRSHAEITHAMERQITIETVKMERYTNLVGTIASTAVYIGLFGTVLGIIRAFHDIATKGAGGIDVVINGISEALVCTAAGLIVAVPAVIAYNYFIKKIDTIVTDMELCASEIQDLISPQ